MKCLLFFGIPSMKEDTSAQLTGRGELHGGLGLYFKLQKSNKNNSVSLNINKRLLGGGLAWIKYPKKDMVVTSSYLGPFRKLVLEGYRAGRFIPALEWPKQGVDFGLF